MAIQVIVPDVPEPILAKIGGLLGPQGPTGNLGPFTFEITGGGDLLLHYAGPEPDFAIDPGGNLILTL